MTETLLQATVSIRGVLLTPRGETLVVKRSSDGQWELPGGRIGPEEDVVPALKRELDEETSLDGDIDGTVHANSWQNDDDNGRFAVYYRCRTDGRDVRLSEEHTEYQWVSYSQATDLLPDDHATAVRHARPEGGIDSRPRAIQSATSD